MNLTLPTNEPAEAYLVVHPIFDEPEQKCDPSSLGRMHMSKSVRTCLMLLRIYLIVMGLMLGYHMLDLAGVFGRHVAR